METMVEEIPNKPLNKMLQDLANFMALYEHSEDRFKIRKEEMDQQLEAMKTELRSQLDEMRTTLTDMNEIMTAAGAARWRLAAEKTMKLGDEHLVSIKEACNVYKKLAEDSVSRLEHISVATEKRVSSALHQLTDENSSLISDFRRKAEESYHELETAASDSISTVKRLLRWLKFDRVATAVIAALLSAFLTSMYVNAEWPWQSFHKAERERMIGKSLIAVWPTLSQSKQMEINKLLGQSPQ